VNSTASTLGSAFVRILFSHPMSLHLFALHCIEGQVCRDAKAATMTQAWMQPSHRLP
jgi:hypothetical protein